MSFQELTPVTLLLVFCAGVFCSKYSEIPAQQRFTKGYNVGQEHAK